MKQKGTKRRKLTIFAADYKDKMIETTTHGRITYETYLSIAKEKMTSNGCDVHTEETGRKIELFRYV